MNTPRTVIITGASSGLGFALAEAFLKRGDNVVGNARSQARLEQAA
ncbi:SDR family NAD(P)-dependent oxidoreductase, partial [Pseudomonas taiwanensis]